MVIRNNEVEVLEPPGLRYQTIGGQRQGVRTMEVWLQTMAPGASTLVHRHACEEVIVVLSGSGGLHDQRVDSPLRAELDVGART